MCIPSGAHIPQKPEFQFNPILRSTKQADIPPSDGGAPPRPTLTAALLPVQASMPPVRLTVSTFPSHSASRNLLASPSGPPPHPPYLSLSAARPRELLGPAPSPAAISAAARSETLGVQVRSAARLSLLPPLDLLLGSKLHDPRSVLDPTAGAASRGIVPPSCCFGWFPFQIWVLLVRLCCFWRDCASSSGLDSCCLGELGGVCGDGFGSWVCGSLGGGAYWLFRLVSCLDRFSGPCLSQ